MRTWPVSAARVHGWCEPAPVNTTRVHGSDDGASTPTTQPVNTAVCTDPKRESELDL